MPASVPRLRLDWNALCLFEETTGLHAFDPKIIASLRKSARALRAMWWAGSLHANPKLTLDEAGAELQRTGIASAVEQVMEALGDAISSSAAGDPPTPAA